MYGIVDNKVSSLRGMRVLFHQIITGPITRAWHPRSQLKRDVLSLPGVRLHTARSIPSQPTVCAQESKRTRRPIGQKVLIYNLVE